jgi:RNA recognition motif-containing protein
MGNLDVETTEQELTDFLNNVCGPVSFVKLAGIPNVSRFAFVEFSKIEGAMKALKMTGTLFKEKPLKYVLLTHLFGIHIS